MFLMRTLWTYLFDHRIGELDEYIMQFNYVSFLSSFQYIHYQFIPNVTPFLRQLNHHTTSVFSIGIISLAISMYEKFGYVKYRRVLGYYSGDDAEDALDMRKALPRDTLKQSVIPLDKPVSPEDLEW